MRTKLRQDIFETMRLNFEVCSKVWHEQLVNVIRRQLPESEAILPGFGMVIVMASFQVGGQFPDNQTSLKISNRFLKFYDGNALETDNKRSQDQQLNYEP
jgi:hypothetical protein